MANIDKDEIKFNIDLRTIISDVLHNIMFVILAAIIGGMLTYVAANCLNEKTYSSSVTFVVSASNSSGTVYNNLTTANRMADVFSEVFSSDALQELVMEDLDMDSFPATVESSIVSETNLLVVRVVADTPENAYKILNSIIDNYSELSDYMFSNAVLNIISNPEVPVSAANSISVRTYVKYGIVAMAALMIAMIVLISIMTDTIKSEKALENKLEASLFATVYHEDKNKTVLSKIRKTNKSLLISNPIVGFYFKETFHKMSVKLEYMAKSKGYGTFLITSVEENEGKSTVSANIALSLAENGQKVLLIDADLRKPALYKMFASKKEEVKDFALCLKGEASFKECLKYDSDNNLYLLYNKKGYSDSSELITSESMKKMLELCRKKVDFIIVDSPPVSLVSDTEALNEMVDASLLVVSQNRSLAININDVIEELSSGTAEMIGCVFNNVKTFFKTAGSYGGYGYYKYYGKYDSYSGKKASTEKVKETKKPQSAKE